MDPVGAHLGAAGPDPWLEGGELLLTTGLGVRDSDELQRGFVAGIARRGVVALGFAVGVSVDALPPAMRDACDEHALPLFTMPYEIPFIAVSRLVAHHQFAEHDATLRRARGRTRATASIDGRTLTSAPVLVDDHLEALVVAVSAAPLRLDRIRELTGRDPRAGEHLVAFGRALELLGRDPG